MLRKKEKSPLLSFFGDRPLFRVVGFLLENRLQAFSKSEIARGAGVSWATLYALWPKLEESGMVKAAQKVGNVTLYCLNNEPPLVEALKRVESALIAQAAVPAEAKQPKGKAEPEQTKEARKPRTGHKPFITFSPNLPS